MSFYRYCFFILVCVLLGSVDGSTTEGFTEPTTLYSWIDGEMAVNPVVAEVARHPMMERLKKIDQHGVHLHFLNQPSFSRYEHSVGVYSLLKHFGASEKECLAGLLHDVTHGPFSHMLDQFLPILAGLPHVIFHEEIRPLFFQYTGLNLLLEKAGLSEQELRPELYALLEAPLPDICIDRLEYNLHAALCWNLYSLEEIKELISHLHYADGTFFFDNLEAARTLGDISLFFTLHLWGGEPKERAVDFWLCKSMQRWIQMQSRASDAKMHESLFYGDDQLWLERLKSSEDPLIIRYLSFCRDPLTHFRSICIGQPIGIQKEGETSVHFPLKCRGIDPWVKTDNGVFRLSQLDAGFLLRLELTKVSADRGLWLIIEE